MKKRHILVLSTLLPVGLLAGCGVGTPPPMTPYPPPTTTASTTPSPAPSPTSEPPVSLSPLPPKSPGNAEGEITVVGTVEEGVEHGCKILRTDGQMYQLVGSTDPLIAVGAHLSVRGRPNPNLVTTCQQGTPLQVVQVQPA